MRNTLKRTERGWPGHFIASKNCVYRRNTLLEWGDRRFVISTVGNYRPLHMDGKADTIGINRYYETMAFSAKKVGVYWEADVSNQINFDSEWAISEIEEETDLEADKMHEAVVKELSRTIKKKTPTE